jgi:acetyl-CoA acetyltransferase
MSRMDGLKRGSAAIVGVAESDIGQVADGFSVIDLMAQGVQRALEDCGLTLKDVDGVFSATSQSRLSVLSLCEYLGIDPPFIGSTIVGGSSFEYHVAHAMNAIEQGLCNVAVIAYGSTQRSIGRKQASVREINPYESPFNPFMPSSAYAMAAARHMHQYGTTREQLAAVAVAARAWANLNPQAFMRGPLSVADVLASRMVSSPLTVRDCCLVTDGGAALVMTRAARARDLPKKPVYLLGAAAATTHMNIVAMADLTQTAAIDSGRRAFEMAGLAPRDMDVVELYDAFTINTILFLEDLGFCKKGEGGAFVASGAIAPGGALPVNTNGGGLSCVHPGMYGMFTLVEAVQQLRGEAGARQVAGAELALCHGNGGVLSSQITNILGTESTL